MPPPDNPGNTTPVSEGGFYLRILFGAVLVIGGVVFGVWFASQP